MINWDTLIWAENTASPPYFCYKQTGNLVPVWWPILFLIAGAGVYIYWFSQCFLLHILNTCTYRYVYAHIYVYIVYYMLHYWQHLPHHSTPSNQPKNFRQYVMYKETLLHKGHKLIRLYVCGCGNPLLTNLNTNTQPANTMSAPERAPSPIPIFIKSSTISRNSRTKFDAIACGTWLFKVLGSGCRKLIWNLAIL